MTTSNNFRVLLYSDGSPQALSASVYTASLLNNMPDMLLTIIQIQTCYEKSMGVEYNWLELRPKHKRFYRSCSVGSEFRWVDVWKKSINLSWVERMEERHDWKYINQYYKIINKVNRIYSEKNDFVNYKLIYSNILSAEPYETTDIEDLIIDYAAKNNFNLIIIGTRELTKLNYLIYGNLAKNVQNKSKVPVILVKKLPQDFIDDFVNESTLMPSQLDEIQTFNLYSKYTLF
jgi:hypothetical protein